MEERGVGMGERKRSKMDMEEKVVVECGDEVMVDEKKYANLNNRKVGLLKQPRGTK